LRYQRLKGTTDILPDKIQQWDYLLSTVGEIYRTYAYQRIDVPIFEKTELFTRSIGDVTDIVQKEMYTFEDNGKRSLTLRPEGTASVVRAYLENNLHQQGGIEKLFYFGPMFRAERPQKGRYRQFHQFGSEAIGSTDRLLDAELIAMNMRLLHLLGFTDLQLAINTLGNIQCRERYNTELRKYFLKHDTILTNEEKDRAERNPLRLLDSKNPKLAEIIAQAPTSIDILDAESKEYWQELLSLLTELNISFTINHQLVRGLDYYTHMVFEIRTDALGAQNAVGGGGRYDHLIEELGGKPTPAVGAAFGIERLLLLKETYDINWHYDEPLRIFFSVWDSSVRREYLDLIEQLRSAGIIINTDYEKRSLKSQMKLADKFGAHYVLIAGEEEHIKGELLLRDMRAGEQIQMTPAALIKRFTGTMEAMNND